MNYLLKPEEIEARKLVAYLKLLQAQKKIQLYTHVSNETYTPFWRQKSRNKAVGVRPGVPDYLIVTKSSVIFLELKRTKGGVVSAHQKAWLAALPDKKTYANVCAGAEEAESYLAAVLKSEGSV